MISARTLCLSLALSAAALVGVPRPAQALDPEPFEARFRLEVRGFTVGETTWRVRRGDEGFIYETISRATGIAAMFGVRQVLERSEWKRVGGEFKPASYRYERSGRPDKSTAVLFDWNDGIVQNTRRGKTSRMAVPADTLDKLGYMLVLMEDLRAGKRSVNYHIADGKNRMKVYRLRAAGKERMKTDLGTLEVLRIVREREDDDRETTIWVAPSLDFMPVRIEHREPDDEDVTISIESLSRGAAAAAPGAGAKTPPGAAGNLPDDGR